MFDIGGWEFLIIVIVAIVIIGPKDLPGLIRSVVGWVRKARELAREFQSGIDDLAQEVELEKIGNEFRDGVGLGEAGDIGNTIHQEITSAIDPDGEVIEALEGAKEVIEDDLAKIQEDLDEHDEFGDAIDDVAERPPKDNKKEPVVEAAPEKTDQGKT
ncbi:MAG: Sec-independent protein translocase protein TatB [Alphaproteobacteria bacterium]|jgi:sec-independent protein translocase protein TatB